MPGWTAAVAQQRGVGLEPLEEPAIEVCVPAFGEQRVRAERAGERPCAEQHHGGAGLAHGASEPLKESHPKNKLHLPIQFRETLLLEHLPLHQHRILPQDSFYLLFYQSEKQYIL